MKQAEKRKNEKIDRTFRYDPLQPFTVWSPSNGNRHLLVSGFQRLPSFVASPWPIECLPTDSYALVLYFHVELVLLGAKY